MGILLITLIIAYLQIPHCGVSSLQQTSFNTNVVRYGNHVYLISRFTAVQLAHAKLNKKSLECLDDRI